MESEEHAQGVSTALLGISLRLQTLAEANALYLLEPQAAKAAEVHYC